MKLSQSVKDRMQNLILSAKFSKEEEANTEAFRELADDVYNSFPDISKVPKVPKGWLSTGRTLNLGFNGYRIYLEMSENRPMPYPLANNRQDFDSEHPFTVRFRALTDEKSNIAERKKELRSELGGVLNGVNTDKQLLTIWPEAIQWLPSTPIPLPVVTSVDRLKAMLGDL